MRQEEISRRNQGRGGLADTDLGVTCQGDHPWRAYQVRRETTQEKCQELNSREDQPYKRKLRERRKRRQRQNNERIRGQQTKGEE